MKKVVIQPTEFGIYEVEAYQISVQPDNHVVFGLMLTEKHRPGICHFRWGVKIMVELSEGINSFAPVFNVLNPYRARAGLQLVDAGGNVLTDKTFCETGNPLPWVTVFPCVTIHGLIGQVEARELVLENLGSDAVFIYFKPFWLGENRRSWQLARVKIPTMMWQANRLRFALLVDSNEPATSADLGFIPAGDDGFPALIFKTTWATASVGPNFDLF